MVQSSREPVRVTLNIGSYFQPDYKFENVDQMVIPARRTAWGGLIYHGVETRKPEIFFKNKREMVHANTALLRYYFKSRDYWTYMPEYRPSARPSYNNLPI